MFHKKHLLKVLVLSAVLVAMISGVVKAQDKVTITWLVGLGTGTNTEQIAAQNEVVADFNASQDKINLVINIGASFETTRDTLSTLIAAGTSPDIVGPVGVGGSNAFSDQWADLQPLVDKSKYDLSIFDPSLLSLYQTDGKLLGIPFAVYPSVTYYNRDLFDQAGLAYPPQKFGDKYKMPDGTEVDWNYDTAASVAKLLTIDANGNDATSPDFDAKNIQQFGLNFQWAALRLIWTDFQPASWYDAASGKIAFPDQWRTATQWFVDGMWKDHFIPTNTYASADAFGAGNVFQSGKLGMAIVPLWYTCCLGDSVGKFKWDFATVPMSPDGKYHVATDADTFRLTKGSAHPDEAFTVLSYLLDQGVAKLAPTYGAFPARPTYQQAWIDSKSKQFDWGINWQVAVDSLAYNNPAAEHHESDYPNWQKGYDRTATLLTLLTGDTGGTVDVNKELDTFVSDMNSIIAEKQ